MPAGIFGFLFGGFLSGPCQIRDADSEGSGEVFGGCVEVKFFVCLPEVQNVAGLIDAKHVIVVPRWQLRVPGKQRFR